MLRKKNENNFKQNNSSVIKIEHYKTSKLLIYSMLSKFRTQKEDPKNKTKKKIHYKIQKFKMMKFRSEFNAKINILWLQ